MADIADNEPLMFKDIILEFLEHLPEITKRKGLSSKQKMAYCEILGSLVCSMPSIILKKIGKCLLPDNLRLLVENYVYVLYHSETLKSDAWLSSEVDYPLQGR